MSCYNGHYLKNMIKLEQSWNEYKEIQLNDCLSTKEQWKMGQPFLKQYEMTNIKKKKLQQMMRK